MRRFSWLVGLMVSLLILSACGGSSSSSSGSPAPAAGGGSEPAAAPGGADKYEAAKKEGKVTVYFSSLDEQSCGELVDAFKAKYPGIQVEWLKITAQQVYQRVMQEVDAGIKNVDVITVTDVGRMVEMKGKGLFLKYTPVGEDQELDAFRGLDPDGYYFTHSVEAVAISYNTKQVKPEDLPKKWMDLTDPKWKDKIAIGHPGYSGFVGTFFTQMQLNTGDAFMQGLAANNPFIGKSINDTIPKVISGERALGISADSITTFNKSQGQPIDIYFPEDGGVLMTTPSAIMKDAPHPNAAKLFQDFLFSKEASQALVKRGNHPIRKDVPSAPTSFDLSKVKLQRPTPEQLQQMVPQIIDKFRQYMGV